MAAPRVDRRLAAIMAVDVVGYSRLIGADEAGTLARIKAHRVELAEPLIAEHHGRVVKLTGDGALVEFGSAVDAVECAVAIQRGVAAREAVEPEARRIRYRIGINIGDIVLEDGDIFGDGVNIAARLEGLAKPGEICVARNVHDQVKAKLDFGFEPLGEHRVKNIAEPITVYRVRPGAARPTVGSKAALWRARFWPVAAAGALALIVAGALAWLRPWQAPPSPPAAPTTVAAEAAPALDTHRLAVLPFTSISADTKDDWFADGITEEMITRLSQIPELRVIARTSIIGYKGTSKGVAEIGRELGAGTILEGSVRRAGDQVRVTAQLVDSGSQAHLWAESYDRPMREIFVVQSDVAQKVAEALRITLLADVERRVDRPGTTDSVAHELYLKARRDYYAWTANGMEQAITGFREATTRDPSYAMAYVGLAQAWIDAFWAMPITPREAFANASAAAEHALALDEGLAEAHTALAYVRLYSWDWPAAEAGFKRAIELNPSSAWAHEGYYWAYLSAIRGQYEKALAGMKRARELDPLNPSFANDVGWVHYHAERFDTALEHFQQRVNTTPDDMWANMGVATAAMALRRFDDAIRWYAKSVEIGGGDSMAKAHLGWAYGRAGRTKEARAILDELTSRYPQEKFSPINFVFVYQGLGDMDNAFLWLDRCYETQDFYLIFLETREFEDLAGDPRYAAMKAKIGFPPRG